MNQLFRCAGLMPLGISRWDSSSLGAFNMIGIYRLLHALWTEWEFNYPFMISSLLLINISATVFVKLFKRIMKLSWNFKNVYEYEILGCAHVWSSAIILNNELFDDVYWCVI